MQGEVSVPCMDEDCGNRAGAGAHVVGGLLHVYLVTLARLGKHARIQCTHVINYTNISHVSPRMGTCDAHAELGWGRGTY